MERFVRRLGRRVLLLGVGVLALAGGIAYASIPDSTGTFHACVLSSQGQVRIIDPSHGGQCHANEAAVSWSQTGPAGPTGRHGRNGCDRDHGCDRFDRAHGSRRGRRGRRERPEPRGRRGPGAAGGLNQVQKVQATGTANSFGLATVLVNCPAGTTLTGGGAEILGLIGDAEGLGPRMIASAPFNPNQWIAEALAPASWQTNGQNSRGRSSATRSARRAERRSEAPRGPRSRGASPDQASRGCVRVQRGGRPARCGLHCGRLWQPSQTRALRWTRTGTSPTTSSPSAPKTLRAFETAWRGRCSSVSPPLESAQRSESGRGPIQRSLNMCIASRRWSIGSTSPPTSRRRLGATLHLRCSGFKGLAPACSRMFASGLRARPDPRGFFWSDRSAMR